VAVIPHVVVVVSVVEPSALVVFVVVVVQPMFTEALAPPLTYSKYNSESSSYFAGVDCNSEMVILAIFAMSL